MGLKANGKGGGADEKFMNDGAFHAQTSDALDRSLGRGLLDSHFSTFDIIRVPDRAQLSNEADFDVCMSKLRNKVIDLCSQREANRRTKYHNDYVHSFYRSLYTEVAREMQLAEKPKFVKMSDLRLRLIWKVSTEPGDYYRNNASQLFLYADHVAPIHGDIAYFMRHLCTATMQLGLSFLLHVTYIQVKVVPNTDVPKSEVELMQRVVNEDFKECAKDFVQQLCDQKAPCCAVRNAINVDGVPPGTCKIRCLLAAGDHDDDGHRNDLYTSSQKSQWGMLTKTLVAVLERLGLRLPQAYPITWHGAFVPPEKLEELANDYVDHVVNMLTQISIDCGTKAKDRLQTILACAWLNLRHARKILPLSNPAFVEPHHQRPNEPPNYPECALCLGAFWKSFDPDVECKPLACAWNTSGKSPSHMICRRCMTRLYGEDPILTDTILETTRQKYKKPLSNDGPIPSTCSKLVPCPYCD